MRVGPKRVGNVLTFSLVASKIRSAGVRTRTSVALAAISPIYTVFLFIFLLRVPSAVRKHDILTLLSRIITIRKRYVCAIVVWRHAVASPVVVSIANELCVCKLYGRQKKEKIIIYKKTQQKKKNERLTTNRIRWNIITVIAYTTRVSLLSDRYHEIIMSYFTRGPCRRAYDVQRVSVTSWPICLVQRSARVGFPGAPRCNPSELVRCHRIARMRYFNLYPLPSV
jgi:hypothetical protein